MNITDKRLEQALIERAKTDEEHAKLKVQVEYLDWEKKHKKGLFINNLDEIVQDKKIKN